MNLSFDHLVHFVNSPAQAVEDLNQIGLHAFMGGNHENWGTYNSLSYFGLSYLEFLGISDRNVAEQAAPYHDLTRQAISLLPGSQGFNRIALRTDNIEKVASHFINLGYKTDGPIPGSRKRDDGVTLHWKMLFFESNQGLPLPFIIQWDQSDEERKLDLHEKINSHPLGKVEVKELFIAVRNLQETAEKWGQLFGLKASQAYKDEELQTKCIQMSLKRGKSYIHIPRDWKFSFENYEEKRRRTFLGKAERGKSC